MYLILDFDHQMKGLKKIQKKVYQHLYEVEVHKWAHTYSPVRRYYLITTNIVEPLNYTLKHTLKFPITTLIDFVRDMM